MSLLKVKTFHDADGVVIAHVPGKGRHKGRLGALVVHTADGTEFSVGTGFSDKERENPPAIGSAITYRYQELSTGGVPRFPSFVRLRSDAEKRMGKPRDTHTTQPGPPPERKYGKTTDSTDDTDQDILEIQKLNRSQQREQRLAPGPRFLSFALSRHSHGVVCRFVNRRFYPCHPCNPWSRFLPRLTFYAVREESGA